MSRWLYALSLLLFIVGFAPEARADNKALAETLFLEGKEMLKQGNLEQACKRFRASHQAEPSVGAVLNLARCHQKLGKLASAWSEFTEAAALAERMNQPDRRAGAQAYAEELAPRLSKLTVTVTSPVEGMEVTRDGLPLPSGSFGVAVPIDGGTHTIQASAPGHKTWSVEVVVGAEKDSQSITIPALVEEEQTDDPIDEQNEGLHTQAIVGLVVMSVGVPTLAVGIVLGVVAINQDSEVNCQDLLCNSDEYTKVQDIKPIAHASTALVVIGAATILGGGILFLTAPSGGADEPTVGVLPVVTPTFQGVGIQGQF